MAYLVDSQRVQESFMGIIRADLHLENSEDRALFDPELKP